MRAAVMRDWQLRVDDLPDPTPGPGQVLGKVLACGSCGSDLHLLRHGEESRRLMDGPDAGRPLEQEYVAMSRLVIEVTSDARVAGTEHRWSLALPDEPVVVRGDEHRLHQVVANILSNARTHTPAGTSVVVRLRAAQHPDHQVLLSVSDDGPGIPKELQADIFERFVRADDSRSRAVGSTGLGLSIARAVVLAHGGTLTFISDKGGSEFCIALPVANGR